MTSQLPHNIGSFSAFSSAAAEAGESNQADTRHAGTSEERTVLALEMIADQLALIHRDLCSIDDFARAGASGHAGPASSEEAEQDRWDNEGGGFTEENPATDFSPDPDVTRSTEQHYAVGGYRYTNLQHAIAEAKRARAAASAGLEQRA